MKTKILSLLIGASALLSASLSSGQGNAAPAAGNKSRIDSGLFTTYSLSSDNTSVSLSVCGSTAQSEGCYGGANLGPFGKIGAIIEGNPATNTKTNVVTRDIYIVDVAGGTNKNSVILNVYKKTDTITADFDTVNVTLSKAITLPLTGGASVAASMAANNGYLFIGTDQSQAAVEVNKKSFAVTQIGGFSPPINVSAITADQYGYVTVTFGSFTGGESGFYVFGPEGSGEEDGGGADFMVSTVQAVLPSTLH